MSSVGLSRVQVMEKLQAILERIVASSVNISEALEIYRDLGIAGDDAWDMIDEIQKQFGTRFEGLEFDKHFPGEQEALFLHIGKLFGLRKKIGKSLTFGHLVDVIEKGVWFE